MSGRYAIAVDGEFYLVVGTGTNGAVDLNGKTITSIHRFLEEREENKDDKRRARK